MNRNEIEKNKKVFNITNKLNFLDIQIELLKNDLSKIKDKLSDSEELKLSLAEELVAIEHNKNG